MALAMKTACERCSTGLQPGDAAFVCSYECTFCPSCRDALQRCPDCDGELVRRPRRSPPAAAEDAAPEARRDGARDFDFLHGRWRVENRRLEQRLAGCTSWESFDATLDVRPVLLGLGNVDCYATRRDGRPFEGLTLRLYDPEARQWSLYWADSWSGRLQPPLVGGFSGERGHFLATGEHAGRRILVRFLWDVADGDHARWEQAYSDDGGTTWETNWVMDFQRVGGVGEPRAD